MNAVCQRAAEILEAFPEVVAAYVFGSFGRGEGAATSDVDVAVLSTGSAGFRNILVHGYIDVRVDVAHDVLVHHLEDLTAFIEAIRSRL